METIFAQFNEQKDESVIKQFRQKAGAKFDNKQGAIKKALLEALALWVKAN